MICLSLGIVGLPGFGYKRRVMVRYSSVYDSFIVVLVCVRLGYIESIWAGFHWVGLGWVGLG